jgi:hypothetical protein
VLLTSKVSAFLIPAILAALHHAQIITLAFHFFHLDPS